MTSPLRPGPAATPTDLRAAQRRQALLATELPRVRAHSAAWRNSLAGLLAALVGFSLIRGRSDIGQLAASWAAGVGALLLAALIAGAIGALSLVRAASGRLGVLDTADQRLLPDLLADHVEALASLKAMRRGVAFTLLCAGLLVAAVGMTWYGPERQPPALKITTSSGEACGPVLRVASDAVTLGGDTAVTIPLNKIVSMQAVASCAG